MGVLPMIDRFPAPARIQRLSVFALGTILIVLLLENTLFPEASVTSLHRRGDRSRSQHYQQWGAFEPMLIPGYVNTGLPGKRSCDTLKYNSTVGVQQSFHLNDDIHQIAVALDQHPVVDYPDEMMNDPEMDMRDIVEKTWTRLAGSSVWLPEQKVYLSVTRVVFSPSRTRTVPKMSFLRGQLFNEDWDHLTNHTITWSGKQFAFPMVFDIPAQWEDHGGMFGPEDPRVILEEGVEDAEPVIIFNMVSRKSDWKRAMHLFRPFSKASTMLTIKDTERAYNENSWAPFFIPEQEQQTLLGKIPLPVPGVVRKPNEYIHFVYSFRPLHVLKCHMRCGDCEFVYEQDVPDKVFNKHHDEAGSVRGGTNFVPVPIPSSMDIDSRVRVYAAFPQTNIAKFCDGNFYRPEFAVMINIGNQFQLAFASESLDFGDSILELGPDDDRCEKSRILTPNTVVRWDTGSGQDVMTVTFSVNDETTQVSRIRGLLGFVRNLPQFKTLLKRDGLLKGADADLVSILASWVGDDIRGCLIESAANYTGITMEDSDPRDEDQEMDLSKELMLRLKQIKAEEAERNRAKEAGSESSPGNEPALPILEHPPEEEEEAIFHPELLGEFEDVEGLAVEGLEDEGAEDEGKEDNPKEDELPKGEKEQEDDTIEQEKNDVDAKDEALKPEGLDRLVGEDKEQQERKPLHPPKAVHNHDSHHHRYHKQHNWRRAWP
ncbi:glycosyltransferase family 91 protein [Cladophialophora carrionii]|uniref:Glycosyltransferase family 91 protein n=1 Tax=Cladophialophora carrionii TaxID=86049 RepID=A0A1C1CFR7_9EURO|nr:glycosyltransferase family 91 protein [Cladophialophora carrionii]